MCASVNEWSHHAATQHSSFLSSPQTHHTRVHSSPMFSQKHDFHALARKLRLSPHYWTTRKDSITWCLIQSPLETPLFSISVRYFTAHQFPAPTLRRATLLTVAMFNIESWKFYRKTLISVYRQNCDISFRFDVDGVNDSDLLLCGSGMKEALTTSPLTLFCIVSKWLYCSPSF